MHRATPSFWECYYALPQAVRDLADRNYQILRENPRYPSLHFKKIRDDLWAVRIGIDYRALATKEGDVTLWFWIGSHSAYDLLLRH